MSDKEFVLDTSALLSLIEDEQGADRVEQVLREEIIWLPWPVLLEVVYITRQERGEDEANRRYAMSKQLPVTVIWEVDEPVLLTAARFKAGYHLSLADAVIAAFAFSKKATLLHKDPEFDALEGQVLLEGLEHKK